MTSLVLIGCYTTDGLPGLRSARLYDDGTIEPAGALATESPSCVVWHPRLPVAYAANETPAGGITAVSVDVAGGLRAIGTATTGAAPCHLAVSADERWLLSADYVGGTVTLVGLAPDGRPTETLDVLRMRGSGPDPVRQDAPHPHMIATDVAGQALLCVDLGTDRLTSLAVTDDGRLRELRSWSVPPGTGPRQVVPHPGGDGMLVLGELSATLLHVRPGTAGDVEVVSEVPTTTSADALPAQLSVDAAGTHVLVSNRGPGTIGVFAVRGGAPRQVAEVAVDADWPRHFLLTDRHLLVAGERSSTIASYELGGEVVVGPLVRVLETTAPTWLAQRPV